MSASEFFFALASRHRAEGAWPNDSVVRKMNSRPNDATPDGGQGVVIGSLPVRAHGPATFGYFVVWDHAPGLPVFCADTNDDGTPRLELAP